MNNNVYIPTAQPLQKVIRSIWQIDHNTLYHEETIIPKGVVEIIFNLDENALIASQIDQTVSQLPKCFINGFNTVPIQLRLPKRHFFFGVQFHPIAIRHYFGVPAGEFSNQTVDLTLLSPTFDSLWHQLAEAQSFEERVIHISQWIAQKNVNLFPQEQFLNAFFENNQNHHLTTGQLAQKMYYSPRHLSRKMHELTGMNTEQLLLYKKYLHALQLMHHTDWSLTAIAYDSHFADQSHFTKTFKAFSGMTPGEYKQNKGYIPGHLLKNVR